METIAVLDDDSALVELYKSILGEEGYTVAPVPFSVNLQTVLDSIRALQPVLLILDVRLPGVDSQEVIEGLHQPGGGTQPPILVCSAAYNEIVEMEQRLIARGLKMPAVMEKPFELDDFVEMITRLSAGKGA